MCMSEGADGDSAKGRWDRGMIHLTPTWVAELGGDSYVHGADSVEFTAPIDSPSCSCGPESVSCRADPAFPGHVTAPWQGRFS